VDEIARASRGEARQCCIMLRVGGSARQAGGDGPRYRGDSVIASGMSWRMLAARGWAVDGVPLERLARLVGRRRDRGSWRSVARRVRVLDDEARTRPSSRRTAASGSRNFPSVKTASATRRARARFPATPNAGAGAGDLGRRVSQGASDEPVDSMRPTAAVRSPTEGARQARRLPRPRRQDHERAVRAALRQRAVGRERGRCTRAPGL